MVAIVFFVALALMVVDVVGPLREMSYRLLLLAVVQAKGSDDNTLKKKDARECKF